jgi:aminopeptidase N
LVAETDELGVLAAVETARNFIQPEQAGLLAPYAERYFDALPRIWSSRGEHIRVQLSQMLFPHPAASPRLLERIDAFLAVERPDPGLARVLIEKRDIVAHALRSRALPVL